MAWPLNVLDMFDDVNNDANPTVKKLRPIGRARGFFWGVRISVRGQIIEDIHNYNNVSQLFQISQTRGSRGDDMVEEFWYNADISYLAKTNLLPGVSTQKQ